MKTVLQRMLAVSVGLFGFSVTWASYGALVAGWTFDGQSVSADQGAQAGSATVGSSLSTLTTINPGDGGSGYGLRVIPPVSGESSFYLSFSGAGWSGFSLSYSGKVYPFASNLGNVSQAWFYSLNGGSSYNPLGLAPADLVNSAGSSWPTFSFDLSSVTPLNNQSSILLKDVLTGNSQQGVFDNIQISAVPEPVNMALVVFGLCIAGVCLGRRVCARSLA